MWGFRPLRLCRKSVFFLRLRQVWQACAVPVFLALARGLGLELRRRFVDNGVCLNLLAQFPRTTVGL